MDEEALSNHSYETYLTLEEESDQKYEFHAGYISAMAGGTPDHSLIAENFIGEIRGSAFYVLVFFQD